MPPKFQVQGDVPHQPFFVSENYTNFPSYGVKMSAEFSFLLEEKWSIVTIHVSEGQTDGWTDGLAIRKTALHTIQHSKNYSRNARVIVQHKAAPFFKADGVQKV